MNDPALPAAMLVAAFGLLTGYATQRDAVFGIGGFVMIVGLVALLRVAPFAPPIAILLCWGGIVLLTGLVWGAWHDRVVLFTAAAVAGVVVGFALATVGRPPLAPLSALLIAIPARIAVRHELQVAPRVVASWLTAVALLAALIPYAIPHPGYVPDHRG